MKVLLISSDCSGISLATKLRREGHSVQLWIPGERYEYVSYGILERVSSWRRSAADWADLVICDSAGFGHHAKVLDEFEKLHLGFNELADVLELDPGRQLTVLRHYGIPTPETLSFETPLAARDLGALWSNNIKGFVLKPVGKIRSGDTIVVQDERLLEWALNQYSGDQDLLAKRYIEGIPVSIIGWFNELEWIQPFFLAFHDRHFLNGNLGPDIGCAGSTILPITSQKNRLVTELKKLTYFLKKMAYKGPIEMSFVAEAGGVWAVDVTSHLGFNGLEAWFKLIEDPIGHFLRDIRLGQISYLRYRNEVSVSINVSVPPYPYIVPSPLDRGLPVVCDCDSPNIYPIDLYKDQEMARWAASSGHILTVVGSGPNIRAARKAAYKTIDKISTYAIQYRSDVGEQVEQYMKKLRKWSYM